MNSEKTGNIIRHLRTQKGMTQLELAEKIHVTDRAVSKWERGEGCPDITLVHALAAVLGVSESTLLAGSFDENEKDTGNMKHVKFFICPVCGSIFTGTGDPSISCCGRTLFPQQIHDADRQHILNIQTSDDEFCITFTHSMEKSHYLSFIAYSTGDTLLIKRLYAEQSGELTMPRMRGGRFIFGCTRDGVFSQKE
jgi:DNA-binding XRE family transcriptional regulator